MHVCHAHGCRSLVAPKYLACPKHWYSLRKELRDAVYREYRRGQEIDKRASLRYLCVQQRAVAEMAFKPHDRQAARDAAPYLINSELIRRRCIAMDLGDPLEGISKAPMDIALERIGH